MRVIVFLLFILLFTGPIFAYSDIGLLKKQKTIGAFVLSPNNSSDLSYGLVYNQKQNDKLAFEFSCANYYKIYPFMKDVIKMRLDGKYKLLESGPITVTALAGPTIYYAASVGAGLAANAGGIISVQPSNYFAASFFADATLFKDGLRSELEPMISIAPPFLKNTEFYGGFRLEASKVGFSLADMSGGKINYYLDYGVRVGM